MLLFFAATVDCIYPSRRANYPQGHWVLNEGKQVFTGSIWPMSIYQMAWQSCDWQHCDGTYTWGSGSNKVTFQIKGWYNNGWTSRNTMLNDMVSHFSKEGGVYENGGWVTTSDTYIRTINAANSDWINIFISGPEPSYYDDCVAIHNQYRAQWGLPAVSYNSQLAASAYNWAKQLSDSGSFYHSGGNYGENLYSGTIATCRAAIDMWAAEKSNYHCEPIGSGSFSSYGHYTQMASPFNSVGCGIYGHVVACHYDRIQISNTKAPC